MPFVSWRLSIKAAAVEEEASYKEWMATSEQTRDIWESLIVSLVLIIICRWAWYEINFMGKVEKIIKVLKKCKSFELCFWRVDLNWIIPSCPLFQVIHVHRSKWLHFTTDGYTSALHTQLFVFHQRCGLVWNFPLLKLVDFKKCSFNKYSIQSFIINWNSLLHIIFGM